MMDFEEFVQDGIDCGLDESERTAEAYEIYTMEWIADMRQEMQDGR